LNIEIDLFGKDIVKRNFFYRADPGSGESKVKANAQKAEGRRQRAAK